MCGYMGVDPTTINFEIVSDENMPNAVGLYQMREKSIISVAHSQLTNPTKLLATFAHELAHELLLKGGHLSSSTSDHEFVTDLLPVFLGTGIFLANATVESNNWSEGNMHFFTISKQGYFSSITLGYALALFAFMRKELRPTWATHLRTDAAATLKSSLRYLSKTDDTIFHPDTFCSQKSEPTTNSLAERFAHSSPTFRLAALWDLKEFSVPPTELLPVVQKCINDRDSDVQRGAVIALGLFGDKALTSIPQLIQFAWYGTSVTRVSAIQSMSEIGTPAQEIISALASVLEDQNSDVVCAAANALSRFGNLTLAVESQLFRAIQKFAAVTDVTTVESLVETVYQISKDLPKRLKESFAGNDPEGLRFVLRILRDRSDKSTFTTTDKTPTYKIIDQTLISHGSSGISTS